MRIIRNINDGWNFAREALEYGDLASTDPGIWKPVDIPHTWNNLDGQDGGDDYYRGACWYRKRLPLDSAWCGKRIFIEFEGVSLVAGVYLNGTCLGTHRNGFSTFRFEITDLIRWHGENVLCVKADNSDNPAVYPRVADFTFYGGIYRNVNLVVVAASHFDLMDDGSSGVYITPKVEGDRAVVEIKARVVNPEGCRAVYSILDARDEVISSTEVEAARETVTLTIDHPRLWSGRRDPYLYRLRAEVVGQDCLEIPFGIRTFHVDPDVGFFLNGQPYPLYGVSRHQDREDRGWAITAEEHREDMELIKEIGATSIRLAHYQHAQFFYDLCDREGFVVWAEIPFISEFSGDDQARENARLQMRELVKQNYNHPSICFWGLQNEITIGGFSQRIVESVEELNRLAKSLDPTRLTTAANLMMVELDSPLNYIPDVLGYNLYYGWYVGRVEDFDTWLDQYRQKNPRVPLAISEYGCEGILKYHTDNPVIRDYSEEYHAQYHEQAWEIFSRRPWLWATYVWNMFDFGSDLRDEGGVKGRNNKGLVTYDRKIKKDAFYFYKACWSEEKFVHITGRRYLQRAGEKATIKVYSNCPRVRLLVNGEEMGVLAGRIIFSFEDVPLVPGENVIKACTEEGGEDMITLIRVEQPNPGYVLPSTEKEKGSLNVENWFAEIAAKQGREAAPELVFPEGHYSIKDKIGELLHNGPTRAVLAKFAGEEMLRHPMLAMVENMSLEELAEMLPDTIPADVVKYINADLIKVKK